MRLLVGLLTLILIFGGISLETSKIEVKAGETTLIKGTVSLPIKDKTYTLKLNSPVKVIGDSQITFKPDENNQTESFTFIIQPEYEGKYYASLLLLDENNNILDSKTITIEVEKETPKVYLDEDWYVVYLGESVKITGRVKTQEEVELRIEAPGFEVSPYESLLINSNTDFSFILSPKNIQPGTYYISLILYKMDGSIADSETARIIVKQKTTKLEEIEVNTYFKINSNQILTIPVKIKNVSPYTQYTLKVQTDLGVDKTEYNFVPEYANQVLDFEINVYPNDNILTHTVKLLLYKNNNLITSKTIKVEITPKEEFQIESDEIYMKDGYLIIPFTIRNTSNITTKIKISTDYSSAIITPEEITLSPGGYQEVTIKLPFNFVSIPSVLEVKIQGYETHKIKIPIPKTKYEISVDIEVPNTITIEKYAEIPIKIVNMKDITVKGKFELELDGFELIGSKEYTLYPYGQVTDKILIARYAPQGEYTGKICFKYENYFGKVCKSILLKGIKREYNLNDYIENDTTITRTLTIKLKEKSDNLKVTPEEVEITLSPGESIKISEILSNFKIEGYGKAKFIIKEGNVEIGEFTYEISTPPFGHAFLMGGLGALIILIIGAILGFVVSNLFRQRKKEFDIESHELSKELKE